MRRLFYALPALALLGFSTAGCAHRAYHRAKAEYHEEKAERAWETGHPVKALKEKVKEHREERKADF